MRKLASIKEINDLIPIEGRDRIELAIIDGWQVIAKVWLYAAMFQSGQPAVSLDV